MTTPSAVEQLVQRMLTYDGNFDGYPSMTCSDEELIWAAVKERNDGKEGTEGGAITLVAWLASESAKTLEQYDRCFGFYNAFVSVCWACNMQEGSNPIYEAMQASE